MPHVNRVVIGANDEKKSAVIYRDSPNHQEVPEIFWRSTLWATTELPVNNQAPGDRGADVTAARVLGATTRRIVGRHILPNVLPVLLVQTALMMGEAVLLEAAFSFLGLGSRPPAPSWGTMLNNGRNFLAQAPWLGLFPGLVITITILGLNALSDGLRAALGPRAV